MGAKEDLATVALPHVASVFTAMPYNTPLSRTLDKLLVLSEGEGVQCSSS